MGNIAARTWNRCLSLGCRNASTASGSLAHCAMPLSHCPLLVKLLKGTSHYWLLLSWQSPEIVPASRVQTDDQRAKQVIRSSIRGCIHRYPLGECMSSPKGTATDQFDNCQFQCRHGVVRAISFFSKESRNPDFMWLSQFLNVGFVSFTNTA